MVSSVRCHLQRELIRALLAQTKPFLLIRRCVVETTSAVEARWMHYRSQKTKAQLQHDCAVVDRRAFSFSCPKNTGTRESNSNTVFGIVG